MPKLFNLLPCVLCLLLLACQKPYVLERHHRAVGTSERIGFIVLHYTAEDDANSLEILTTKQVSSHYLIPTGNTKTIYQLVADDKAAWHAGASSFGDRTRFNDIAIGIEIVNEGIAKEYLNHKGYHPYTHFVAYQDAQIAKLGALLQTLSKQYNIPPKHILAHSDIAPSRKIDVGAKFPWQRLYQDYGIGAWYDEVDRQYFLQVVDFDKLSISEIKAELRAYGYTINDSDHWDKASSDVVYAFQLHFNPMYATGVMDKNSFAILKALNKKYPNTPQ